MKGSLACRSLACSTRSLLKSKWAGVVTAGWVYRFTAGFDPSVAEDLRDWEIDPSTLEIGRKVGEGEFGTVHKV